MTIGRLVLACLLAVWGPSHATARAERAVDDPVQAASPRRLQLLQDLDKGKEARVSSPAQFCRTGDQKYLISTADAADQDWDDRLRLTVTRKDDGVFVTIYPKKNSADAATILAEFAMLIVRIGECKRIKAPPERMLGLLPVRFVRFSGGHSLDTPDGVKIRIRGARTP